MENPTTQPGGTVPAVGSSGGSAPLIKLLDSIQVELRLRGLGPAGDVIALAVMNIERQRDALNAAHRFWYGSTGEGEPGRTHSQYRIAAAEVRMQIEVALDLPNVRDQERPANDSK